MSNSSADQNLLFGVLALELDFIDRDQLIQAMRGWVEDKSKSLGQVFVERGELTAHRLELLQGLVAEHVKQHGDDTNASLVSFESTQSLLQDLKQVPDDGLQATIDFVSPPDKSGFIEAKPSAVGAPAPIAGDRFEVIKKHAAGGLGEVFEAKDKELHRIVALKRIKSRFAHHDKSRERFKLEAEITGRLEHPGVVPVYSMGQQDDGQPFYAMRFIEGVTLADAIKELHEKKSDDATTDRRAALDLRRLLQRFIDVCQTIEYAHDRGVLHRDIKPANVMLGRFGETLVVDWGLAKAAGRDVGHVRSDESTIHPAHAGGTTPTLSGSAIGTPPFMSPEQAAGKIEELTAASDVYSLGATLYTLLTGTTCVRGSDRDTAIKRVKEGDFPRPRQVKPSIPRALEAICLKAMALEPEDRYESARSLAEDVEHWLADEPVAAHHESWLERSGRWMRRHRTWVRAGMAAMLLVALVSVSATILINHSWQSERRAREAAIAHFREAQDAVARLTGASSVMKYYPGAQRARARLLELAAREYERYAAQHSENPEVQMEAGRSRVRLGDVRRMLGDLDEAEDAYSQALKVFRNIENRHGDAVDCRVDFAEAHTKLALLSVETGDLDRAGHLYQQAIAQLKGRTDDERRDPRVGDALATAYLNYGVLYFERGNSDEAMASIKRALGEFERVLEYEPDDRRLLEGAARSHTALSQILNRTGEVTKAADHLNTATRHLGGLLRQYPDDVDLLDNRAATQIYVAGLQRSLGHYDQELAAYEQAIDDYQALRRALPDVPTFHENLALTQTDVAQLYLEQGRAGEIEKLAREALAVFEGLVKEIPSVPRYLEEQAACLDVLGRALSDSGRRGEARQVLERSVQDFSQLADQFPGVPEYKVRRAAAQSHLGELLHKLGEHDAARQTFEAATDDLQREANLAPAAMQTHDLLAQVHERFGYVLADQNETEEAAAAFRRAIDLWDSMADAETPPDYLDRYAWLLATCPVEEIRDADKSAAHASTAVSRAPNNPNYLRTLAAALLLQEDWQGAEEKLVAARTLRGEPHGRDLFLMAIARSGGGDSIAARAYFNEAVAWMEENQPDNLDLERLRLEVEKSLGDQPDGE